MLLKTFKPLSFSSLFHFERNEITQKGCSMKMIALSFISCTTFPSVRGVHAKSKQIIIIY